MFSAALALASISAAAGHATDCTVVEETSGQRMVWVPGCAGPGCNAKGIDQDCAWCVFDLAKCEGVYGADCRATQAARQAQNAICYDVAFDSFAIAGYGCKGNETDVFYPKNATGPFPVVVYGHGMGGGLDGRKHSMRALATRGLVVIAPKTGGYVADEHFHENCSLWFNGSVYTDPDEFRTITHGSTYFNDPNGTTHGIYENCTNTTIPSTCKSSVEWQDMVLAVKESRTRGASLHPALAEGFADFSHLGVWGYSMGGKTAPSMAKLPHLGIRAMVAEHGARYSQRVKVPSMYLTSTLDTSSSPPAYMESQFGKNKAHNKVFFNLNETFHEGPIMNGTMDVWVAKFLGCHLKSKSRVADCCDIYGGGPQSICQVQRGVPVADCIVKQASSMKCEAECSGGSFDECTEACELVLGSAAYCADNCHWKCDAFSESLLV